MDFILGLPAEIQGVIFSNLTLQERIRCTGVCKEWRFAVLGYSKMWHTLTNEGFRYELSPVLTIFEAFIQGSSIKEIEFTMKTHSFSRIQAIKKDLTQVIDLFEAWKCSCIEKAIFSFSCYDKGWFKKFQELSCNSLTHLSFQWDVYPEIDIIAFPSFVIGQFPNLLHFVLTMGKMSCWFRPSSFIKCQMYRLLLGDHWIEDNTIGNNSSLLPPMYQCSRTHYRHQNLTSIHFDFCKADFALSFPEILLKSLPNLQHITYCAKDCRGKSSVKSFYEALVKYCHHIETLCFDYNHPNDNEYNLIDDTSSYKIENFTQQHFTFPPSKQKYHCSLKSFQLYGNWATNASIQHLLCVTPIYHRSLESLELTCLPQEHLMVLSMFEFPRLRKFIVDSSNNFKGSVSSSSNSSSITSGCNNNYTKTMVTFFKQTKHIQYIFMKNVQVSDSVINSLLNEHRSLKTLILDDCHGEINRYGSSSASTLSNYRTNSINTWSLSIKSSSF